MRKFTIWQNIKWVASVWLLWWAYCLLPEDSPEAAEMLQFITLHTRRSIKRDEVTTTHEHQ